MSRKEVAAIIVSIWVIPVSVFVNRIVPDPHMDEIFHIPQDLQYCNANFRSWDPMITTPPDKNRRKIWVLIYVLATAAVLAPAPLIEVNENEIGFRFLDGIRIC